MGTRRQKRLLGEERRREILSVVEREGSVTVNDLVNRFAVSAVTLRSDLDVLDQHGALVRSHGGAVRHLNPSQDYPLDFKATIHRAEKVRIGLAAAKLLQPNQTIILDSGTTTAELARHIRQQQIKGLTVLTNALNIANELAGVQSLTLLMIGGILRHLSNSFVGPQAEAMLSALHADHLFLAVDGLDLEVGPTTPDLFEAQLNSQMMNVSDQVTVLADASKIGRRSLFVISNIRSVHRLITDNHISPEIAQALRDRGLDVIVV
jgi:DeoR family transcriptional regulator, aga operon transcriptional repressor